MKNLLFYIAILCPICIYGQDYKEIDFSMIIGDCFKNDTVSLKINEKPIFDSIIIESDFSTGLTGLTVYQVKDVLIINNGIQRIDSKKMTITKTINISLRVNSDNYSKSVILKKGKIIVIDYCYRRNDKGETVKAINMQQYKKNVEFD